MNIASAWQLHGGKIHKNFLLSFYSFSSFKFLFSFSFLIFPVISFSQSSVIELNWTDLLEGTWNNQTYKAPTINGIPLDIAAPNYYYAQKVKSSGNATLQNATYVPASVEEINFLSQFNSSFLVLPGLVPANDFIANWLLKSSNFRYSPLLLESFLRLRLFSPDECMVLL